MSTGGEIRRPKKVRCRTCKRYFGQGNGSTTGKINHRENSRRPCRCRICWGWRVYYARKMSMAESRYRALEKEVAELREQLAREAS